MFARVTIFQLRPGAADDLIRHFQDVIALAAAEQSGFQGMTLLMDDQVGRALSVDLWATEADLLTDESATYHEQIAQISDLLDATPITEVYDVGVHVELSEQGTARIRGI
jgi:heme-degrading monooxygenase HmoA